MRPRLLIFTKPATPGRVKTRLAATIGEHRAAELHRALVGDVAAELRDHPRFELELAWALDEGEAAPDWPELRGLEWQRQVGDDLGRRLFSALSRAAAAGVPVAAVGSDHPELRAAEVVEAFDLLAGSGGRPPVDMVLGPAADGGYYLIALRPERVRSRLFEQIDWSTDRVRQQTLERAAELGLEVAELGRGHDIDREQDLRRLALRLESDELTCERTARLLEAWGWIGRLEAGPLEHGRLENGPLENGPLEEEVCGS